MMNSQDTVAEIAQRLEMDSSYLENIEADLINPMQIMRERIADIMELFRIPFSEFTKTIESLHALNAALVEIAKQEGRIPKKPIQINSEYLKGIREELIRRNRADLLV